MELEVPCKLQKMVVPFPQQTHGVVTYVHMIIKRGCEMEKPTI